MDELKCKDGKQGYETRIYNEKKWEAPNEEVDIWSKQDVTESHFSGMKGLILQKVIWIFILTKVILI